MNHTGRHCDCLIARSEKKITTSGIHSLLILDVCHEYTRGASERERKHWQLRNKDDCLPNTRTSAPRWLFDAKKYKKMSLVKKKIEFPGCEEKNHFSFSVSLTFANTRNRSGENRSRAIVTQNKTMTKQKKKKKNVGSLVLPVLRLMIETSNQPVLSYSNYSDSNS